MYVRLTAGVTTTEDADSDQNEDAEFDEGFLFSLALGTRVTSNPTVNLDVELEGLWSQQDASNSGVLQAVEDITVAGVLINAIGDFAVAERVSIYGGGGIGLTWVEVGQDNDNLGSFDEDEGPFFAWQVRTGLLFRFTPSFAGNVGYRFINIDNVEVDDDTNNVSFDLETIQHCLELGARFAI